MKRYSRDFYDTRHQRTVYSANTILSIIFSRIPEIDSAVDIGCGVGTWLSVLREKGVKDILGIDGEWMDKDLLVIPGDCFQAVDLSQTIVPAARKFDLAISLEVAEHLPADRSQGFVAMLTEFADCVLFSAAVPNQGGLNHINEQWPSYWVDLFRKRSYAVCDLIRPRIWHNKGIPFWYRQNVLLFMKQAQRDETLGESSLLGADPRIMDVVHPDSNSARAQAAVGVGGGSRLLLRSIRRCVRNRLGMRPRARDAGDFSD